jgi:chromosome segregation protein
MHLRSITMKGFKSFPDRTRLEFAEGVSVIVGPNGSGKSNVTDAVLWALGEQSPLAVRGQTMQDVIFSGAPGVAQRAAAEVEVVIDDSGFELGADFAELSVTRRLDRSGEGEYRLNGARCRLVDVIEALSDSGLGKEMHSVVSQGRVESVIHSSPRERRLLIEEAAGLGKHRKRRRRAELKLSRTEDNLGRALDVEREARSHLRPLKRQAEAADLHERLERQSVAARLELAVEAARSAGATRAQAERQAETARSRRAEAEEGLTAVRARRERAERAFEEHGRAREALAARQFAATTAADRVEMRLERVGAIASRAAQDAERLRADLRRVEEAERAEDPAPGSAGSGSSKRVARLEAELAALDAPTDSPSDPEIERLRAERRASEGRHADLGRTANERREALSAADREIAPARTARREAAAALDSARTAGARARAELEAVAQLARRAAPAPGDAGALAEHLRVEPGYELALAAALGPLVRAGLAQALGEANALLDDDAGTSATLLVERPAAAGPGAGATPPPAPGAERLLDRVDPSPRARGAAARLLATTWVVESIEDVADGFRGLAVTRAGRALVAATGELRQVAPAEEHLLERLSRRDELAAAARETEGRIAAAEREARTAAEAVSELERARDRAAEVHGAAVREAEAADEAVHAASRALERREEAADRSVAIRRAELAAELRVERRIAERAARERLDRGRRAERARKGAERADALRLAAESAPPPFEAALVAIGGHRESLRADLAAGHAAGAHAGQELRSCAHEEAELQGALRAVGEAVTEAEVAAQRARDAAGEAERELGALQDRLGGEPAAAPPEPLSDERRGELEERIERLGRRRERIGPVNPLAKAEYEEAVARVEELEAQRADLETALAELRGIIDDTDRRIRETFERTFEATARNFEEVVEELFPGGRGRLRLVTPAGPRPVLGGESASGEPASEPEADSAGTEPSGPDGDEASGAEAREPGVEVEVTPAGKSTRRLSLMSGGERSLVALAFLFSVFLARPCPFYVLDEVEAALDDTNIDRFLRLVRRCSERAQFIVVTHQKRTMDAADRLYGVSMGGDGISKVVSRRLPRERGELESVTVATDAEAAA